MSDPSKHASSTDRMRSVRSPEAVLVESVKEAIKQPVKEAVQQAVSEALQGDKAVQGSSTHVRPTSSRHNSVPVSDKKSTLDQPVPMGRPAESKQDKRARTEAKPIVDNSNETLPKPMEVTIQGTVSKFSS